MKRPPRPGEWVWIHSASSQGSAFVQVRISHHNGLYLAFDMPGQGPGRNGMIVRWQHSFSVHRFDEGRTWWRRDGEELRAARAAAALA